MNKAAIRTKLNNIKQEIKSIWQKNKAEMEVKKNAQSQKTGQNRVMTPEEKLDETIDESFPASDPPGHY